MRRNLLSYLDFIKYVKFRHYMAAALGVFVMSAVACKKTNNLYPIAPAHEQPTGEDGEGGPTGPIDEPALAFPGAEGFGQKVTGGRGGVVLKVTNLNDAGPGSLRAAVEAKGRRIVIFETSGTIDLKSQLSIRDSCITIAGQTAPGDGIAIKGYPVVVSADNVIVRYLRLRMGSENGVEADGFGGFLHKDIIIDHCSVSWSTDECISFYNNDNFTLQWCIASESLRTSVHVKGSHGYGGIWGGKNASFHHNLVANHDSRNPRFGERANSIYALTDLVDMRNNVIYNWGGNSGYGGEGMNINIVNNYYKPGPATGSGVRNRIYSPDKNKVVGTDVYDIWGKFYIDGNYVDGSPAATNDNWAYGVFNQFHSSYGTVSEADKTAMRMTAPHPFNDNVTTHTAEEAYTRVLEYAGASLVRDAVDKRIVEHVKAGTFTAEGSNGSKNGIIDNPEDVGGWPVLNAKPAPVDTDGDGMPDDWEIANGLDPKIANPNGKSLSLAYDNVEVYINSLVKDITTAQVL